MIERACRLLLSAGMALVVLAGAGASVSAGPSVNTPYPILFVTQVPIPEDFTTIGSVFGNHDPQLQAVGRGGDLWIRYPDGALRNLTAEAGYGETGFQGAQSIAVRDPAVHWSGEKALFSMVIGAPEEQYLWETYHWQIYEVTGLGQGETAAITRVPGQPAGYNNVSPIYDSQDRIIFTSDRPRDGQPHLYPQLDEYEEAATVSGLWQLDPASGALRLLNHAPSGDFTPFIDSYGRVVFTQWDHLQRDQQADADNENALNGQPCDYCTFNWSGEEPDAVPLDTRVEVFPEPRADHDLVGTNLWGHTFNHFFPWVMNQDGSELETLNHIGRHELHDYFPPSLTDDPNLVEYYGQFPRFNPNPIDNFLQITEDPSTPGRYIGVDAPEFYTHAAGQVVSIDAPPSLDADHMAVTYLTHRDTADYTNDPSPDHSGHYRDPLKLSDGVLIAAHTAETGAAGNDGTRANPIPRYRFRLKALSQAANGYLEADQPLTAGISKSVSYWDPDVLVSYSGELWELQPVEVRPQARPADTSAPDLAAPEADAFAQAGIDPETLRSYLLANDLALIVSRNVTTRDDFDRQQQFNLRVPGGVQTIGAPGEIYDTAFMQLFQADLIRGLGGTDDPDPGRRVLAQPLHDPAAANPPTAGLSGSVAVAADGSVAAFVPTGRALTWQLTDETGEGVVRERYWLTFQPGEMRVCTSCHGLSEFDQAGNGPPQNTPQALVQLLGWWSCPDFDGSGAVDAPDLAAIAGRWGQTSNDPHYDRDGDGTVSVVDVMLVASRWGEICSA
ncbi:MAG: hypothetical protein R2844_00840 [Caldilineales bacterium]